MNRFLQKAALLLAMVLGVFGMRANPGEINTARKATLKRHLLSSVLIAILFAIPCFAMSQQTFTYPVNGKQGFSLGEKTRDGMHINYNLGQFTLNQMNYRGEDMSEISISGVFLPNAEGCPDLPVESRMIAIPQGANATLNVVHFETEIIRDVNIAPALRVQAMDEEPERNYVKDMSVYGRNAYYPAEPFVVGESYIRGVDAVMVSISPFQYNPVTKELLVYTNVELSLTFEGGNGQFGDNRLRSPYWDPILAAELMNYDQLPVINYEARMQRWLRDGSEGAEYLIITPNNDDWAEYANQLRDYRTRQGILTKVVRLDEMPATTTDGMKAWFHNAYNTWEIAPVAVCLLGDHGTDMSQYIPAETITHLNSGPCITDNGYADVSGDNLPDMVFSRLVAQDASELPIFVGKQIEYEYTNPNMDYDFYNKPITSCGWDVTSWFQLGAEVSGGYFRNHGCHPRRINSVINNGPGPSPGEAWSVSANSWKLVNYFGPDGLGYIPATPYELGGWAGGTASQLIHAVNEGAFWLLNCGHGNIGHWATPSVNNGDVAQTTNVGKLPFIVMSNCSTGEFNSSSDCFTEAWMRHTYNGNNAGAVGVISATQVSYYHYDELFTFGIYDCFDNNFMPTIGSNVENSGNWLPAFGNVAGKYFLSQTTWYPSAPTNPYLNIICSMYTAHCDAFLRVFTQVPQETAVIHPESVIAGQDVISVTAPSDCVICLSKEKQEGGVDILAVTTATGALQNIAIEPQMSSTEIKVVVTGQNYLRYEGVVDVISTDGPYFVVDDYTPHTAPVNQQTSLGMSIKNMGNGVTSGITTVTLTPSDDRLSIINGTATLGTMPSNGTINLDNAFSFIIADGVRDGTEFPVEVTMSCGEETWTSYIIITAQQASFEYLGLSWVGGFVPGETLSVTATFKNIGHYEAVGAIAQIASTNPYVSFDEESIEIGAVEVNEEVECTFNVGISPDCPESEQIPLLFSINANGNVSTESADLLRNTCNIIFNLYTSLGTGWHNNVLLVDFSDDTPSIELFVAEGQNSQSFMVPIGEGVHVSLSCFSGSYEESCSFTVEYENGVVLYHGINLHAGLLFEFDMDCDEQFSPLNIAVAAEPAEGGIVTGGGTYEPGEICTITAVANENYTFVNWTENGVVVSTNPTYSMTVMANHNFVAHFMPPIAISANTNIEGAGVVTGEGMYGYGEQCTLTASANENYVFDSWSKDGAVVSYFSTYSFTVSEDATYMANFELVSSGIAIGDAVSANNNLPNSSSINDYSLSQQIYTADEMGEACLITGVAFFNTENQNAPSYTIYMTHTDKNSFINGNDWIPLTATDEVFNGEVVMTTGNWTYISFDRPFYYDGTRNIALTVDENNNSSNGMKCRVFNTGEYQSICIRSAQVDYDPTNLTDYTGTQGRMKNQVVFTKLMSSSTSVSVTVIASPAESGAVSGSGEYSMGDTCTVTATANEGYCFANWTKNGNVVSSDPNYSFIVVGESVLTAHFVPEGNIDFADANVKAMCVANWDTNGDGELSYVEAASVRSIGTVFRENTTITSFEELQYFISLTSIHNYAFYNCTSLTGALIIPDAVISIGKSAFRGCKRLTGSLAIPNTVVLIGDEAFYDCYGFNGTLNISNSVTSIGSSAFRGCYGMSGSLTIPNSVTSIGSSAFYGCSGFNGTLTLPDSITVISGGVFGYCRHLTGELTIPNFVTEISSGAFQGCSGLTGTLTIPNTVTSIGDWAFRGCSGLTGSLTIPNSVTSIGKRAFQDCSGLSGSLTIPNSVTSINLSAFEGCSGLSGSLTIPCSVTSIDNHAFYGCSGLTSMILFAETPPAMGTDVLSGVSLSIPVYVPCESVLSYQVAQGWNVFSNIQGMCSPGTITVSSEPSVGGVVAGAGVYDPGTLCTVTASPNEGYGFVYWTENDIVVSTQSEYTFTVSINRNLVAHFASESNIVFADANVKAICVANWDANGDGELSYLEAAMVTSLGEVFRDNMEITSFEELQFFIGLTLISNNAFRNCTSLTGSLYIPNTVTSIGEYAFYGCSGLTGSLTIPNVVISIGDYAFYGCSGLTGSLIIPNAITSIGTSVFYGCSGLTGTLIIPNAVTSIGYSAFRGCSGLTGSLTIPNSVTSIGDYAFRDCSGFTGSLTISNTITSIGNYVFAGCSGFTGSLIIPNSVTSIGYYAFWNCRSFTGALNIPNSVISIGNSAFKGCSGLDGSLTIPSSISSIENEVFCLCSGLSGSLTIPYSINSIGNSAFYGCSGFTGQLTIPNSVTSLGSSAFYGCSGFTGDLVIPSSVSMISSYTFDGCSGFSGDLVIPNSVTLLGSSAFQGCSGFTGQLTIPNSVTSIGYSAFSGCSGFSGDLVVPNSVTSLGSSAFQGCSGFTGRLTIPNSLTTIEQYAFKDCTGLTGDLSIPNSVTSIVFAAFWGCSGLTSLTIGNSVTSIGNCAFYNCMGLTSLTIFAETPPTLTSPNAFNNVPRNIPVYVPCGCVEAYQSAAYWSQFTNIQENCTQQTLTLSQGWNWFSTYVEVYNPIEMLQVVEACLGENGVAIKSSDVYAEYDAGWGEWLGDLNEEGVVNEQMYKVLVSGPCSLNLQGTPAHPADHPITIVQGWNWIGFPSAEAMSLDDAFANFAQEGDIIRNSDGETPYDPEWGWYGDFETLEPGQGYMYYSASNTLRTLVFPASAK